ncbi:permease [Haliangium ochraceum]|uniref:Permease n=1 Tax=Haliangium ochraceum (strain DSM 14365 / JCM 11303 / SMP-2) TaxID=502025 RepID=D0LMN0_HALO1|nr:permease [Haliangium ochraceum]ACY18717.1 permease [Haliangium ochraceum DSM 14365]
MEQGFLHTWGQAALTTAGFFWMALWAFILGYIVSAMIQVFVTKERMQQAMGEAGAKSVGLGTFFGFLSSSCSFAALATTKSLFKKGAGFVPSLAFLLASTNLVIELGMVIAVFLSWQFVVGEYLGGLLLIGFMWIFVALTRPEGLIERARKHLREDEGEDQDAEVPNWKRLIRSKEGWRRVGTRYFMEWKMVWKDVTFGFTVAGVIAAFVPRSFFETLFIGSGGDGDPGVLAVLAQSLIGPVAAFFTFIGSMGNIPLAALLYSNGVAFAGVMAFIFSDLVVFPVVRINAKYYGWKMALYILVTLLVTLVAAALLLHYGFAFFGLMPEGGQGPSIVEQNHFQLDYSFFLNIAFLLATGALAWLVYGSKSKQQHGGGDQHEHGGHGGGHGHSHGGDKGVLERVLLWLALASYLWLAGGLVVHFFVA